MDLMLYRSFTPNRTDNLGGTFSHCQKMWLYLSFFIGKQLPCRTHYSTPRVARELPISISSAFGPVHSEKNSKRNNKLKSLAPPPALLDGQIKIGTIIWQAIITMIHHTKYNLDWTVSLSSNTYHLDMLQKSPYQLQHISLGSYWENCGRIYRKWD